MQLIYLSYPLMISMHSSLELSPKSTWEGCPTKDATPSHSRLSDDKIHQENSSMLDLVPDCTGGAAIPQSTEKAEEFLCDACTITTAPVDGKARMVKSKSKPCQPHLVQALSGGKVVCDENHPMWTSLKICWHCVAVWAALVSMLLGLLPTLGSLTSQA